MNHHISIGVSDIIASGSFYDEILQPLDYIRVFENLHPSEGHQAIGYGVAPKEEIFAIKRRNLEFPCPSPGFHLAFSAPSRGPRPTPYRLRVEVASLIRKSDKF